MIAALFATLQACSLLGVVAISIHRQLTENQENIAIGNLQAKPLVASKLRIAEHPSQRQKRLVYYAHFHGSGGSSLCSFAKRAASNATSGVKLAPRQHQKSACNLWDWERGGNLPTSRFSGCRSLAHYAEEQRSTWVFVETALDVKPPCKGVAFVIVFRDPWARMKSLLKQSQKAPSDALQVMRRMAFGDAIIAPASPVTWTGWPPSVFDPVFQTGAFDNFHVRFLLGTQEGRSLPWGALTEDHLERTKAVLEQFDVVVSEDALASGAAGMLRLLQRAVGYAHFDFGVDGGRAGGLYGFGMRENVHEQDADEVLTKRLGSHGFQELQRLFQKGNELDARLYAWVVQRWNSTKLL